jgi:hypothetical protein
VTEKQDERIGKELGEVLITSVACSTVRGEKQRNDLADFTVNATITFTSSSIFSSADALPGVFR